MIGAAERMRQPRGDSAGVVARMGEARARRAAEGAEELRGREGTRAVMRGREMRGWLDLDQEATASDTELAEWVRRTVDYARSLPPK